MNMIPINYKINCKLKIQLLNILKGTVNYRTDTPVWDQIDMKLYNILDAQLNNMATMPNMTNIKL